MMSRIGSKKGFTPPEKTVVFKHTLSQFETNDGLKPPLTQSVRELRSITGFTLIEVMVAVAILSFGLVMLYNAFFICIDSVTYASNRLNAQIWANNKIWEERDFLLRTNSTSIAGVSGEESFGNRDFSWQKVVEPVGDGLAELSVRLYWKEAARQRSLLYSTYLVL